LPDSDEQFSPVYREISHYNPLDTFKLPSGDARHYQQQYADLYFLRLAKLKPVVEEVGMDAWEGFSVSSSSLVSISSTAYVDRDRSPKSALVA
jgi:DNA polymerase delta subunit 2